MDSLRIRCSLIVCLFVSVGCVSLTHEECQKNDWSGAGRQSALRGERIETVQEHFRECFQANEAAVWDEKLVQGYQQGLTQFCSKENAARFAQAGGEYKGTCALSAESEFQSGYLKNRAEFLETEIKRLRSEVSSLEAEVGSLRGQLLSCQAM